VYDKHYGLIVILVKIKDFEESIRNVQLETKKNVMKNLFTNKVKYLKMKSTSI
jgi:hypothetical protein